MNERILIADDEPLYLRTTGELLRKSGYECHCVADAHQAIAALRREEFDLVLSDLNMPGNLKLELLREHTAASREGSGRHVPMIVITGVPTLPSAVESIRLGIADYLLKPVKFDDLLASVRRALARSEASRVVTPERQSHEWASVFPDMIGNSPAILEVFRIIDRVADTNTNILITGESGTGKEVVAKSIHRHSRRREGRCQVIDCTSIPDSLFESMLFGHKKGAFTGAVSDQVGLLAECDGGTAFFDELGELPLSSQAKLLRAVQERTFTPVGSLAPVTVDTRFICATNRDLAAEVSAGRFRQDLFYRLGVIHVELPPLRKRGDDVIQIAGEFLRRLAPADRPIQGFTAEAIDGLRRYHWPGNIRELRNVIERTIALAKGAEITRDDLPPSMRGDHSTTVTAMDGFGNSSSGNIAGSVAAAGPPGSSTGTETSTSAIGEPSLTAGAAGVASDAAIVDVGRPGGVPGAASAVESVSEPVVDPSTASREQVIRVAEYQYLSGLLTQYSGNVSEAARQAGMSRQGLHKLLKTHELNAADYRR